MKRSIVIGIKYGCNSTQIVDSMPINPVEQGHICARPCKIYCEQRILFDTLFSPRHILSSAIRGA